MDLAREIRNMIYVQALVSDQVLVKEREETEAVLDRRIIPRRSAPTALLQVSRIGNSEANVIFYSLNTFQLSSSYSILGKPSIFNSHATLFRRVLVELWVDAKPPWEKPQDIPDWNSTPDLDSGIALVNIWQNQIRALSPMINLQFLELKVPGLLDSDGGLRRCGVLRYMSLEGVAAHYLKPELFASLPSAIQEGPISRYRGIWVTPGHGNFLSYELCAIHEAWRDLGVKFAWELHDTGYLPLEFGSVIAASKSCKVKPFFNSV